MGAGTRCGNACVDLETSVANCGGCGSPCAAPANAMPTCSQGACGFVCKPGYARCGNECVNLAKDAHHCGDCDNVCSKGGCKGGRCEKEDGDD
jgi:hypothetical protein